MKCFYHIDNDGKCAAAIVRQCFPDIECIPINYNIRFPIETIQPSEVIYIVDYSLSPLEMDALLARTHMVTWIDHHQTAIDKFKDDLNISNLQGIRKSGPGCSGCELTWKYMCVAPVPRAVALIGDYDTWTFKLGEDSNRFYFGSMCMDLSPENPIWHQLFQGYLVDQIIDKGRTVIEYRTEWSKDYLKNWGFDVEFNGFVVRMCNIAQTGSGFFGEAFKTYDIVAPFVLDKRGIVSVSLYSQKVDVSVLAKEMGGGGHKGAAGFQIPVDRFLELFIR